MSAKSWETSPAPSINPNVRTWSLTVT
jgi:hypothetical protein